MALIGLAWLAYALAGGALARITAARWGTKILSATQSYVADPERFIQLRLRDTVILFSIAAALMAIHSVATSLLLRNTRSANLRWIAHAVTGFIVVNLWLTMASHCTLFWLFLWQGRENTNALARFQLKHHLLAEYPARVKAVILGNSQARAQIDETLLNQRLEPHLFTSELHFPGSKAFDIYLAQEHLEPRAAQVVICYVSELNFYGGGASVAAPYFLGFSDCWNPVAREAFRMVPRREIAYGLLGDLLPVFYLRDALAQRILGSGVANIRQRQYDQAMSAEIKTNGVSGPASGFVIDAQSRFQQRAFESFVANCGQRGETLVIIAGQLNPRVGSQINPAVRADMLAFLRELRRRFDTVVLIDDCPAQIESDYDDWTHVNKRQQVQFTEFIARRLGSVLNRAATVASPTNETAIP